MNHYFYGLAADPLTLAHEKIIADLLEDKDAKLYIGLTDHDYKCFANPFETRKRILEAFLDTLPDAGDRVVVLRQDKRTYMFLCGLHDWMDCVVMGEDEYEDLKAGKWHYSNEIMQCWKIKTVPRNADGVSSTKARRLLDEGCAGYEAKDLVSRTTYDMLMDEYALKIDWFDVHPVPDELRCMVVSSWFGMKKGTPAAEAYRRAEKLVDWWMEKIGAAGCAWRLLDRLGREVSVDDETLEGMGGTPD